MKLLIFLWLPAYAVASLRHPPNLEHHFRGWMEKFGKQYETSKEFLKRLQIWTKHNMLIEGHNSQIPPSSFTLGHNQFSDLTFDEFKQLNRLGEHSAGVQMRRGRTSVATETRIARQLQDKLPDEVNWIEKGAVVPVKNQGMCGSCWAFSAIGAIEGAHFIKQGDLVALSEQQLIDCDPLDKGCMGGLMDDAFFVLENSTGLCSEEDYPYAGHRHWFRGCFIDNGFCKAVEHTRVESFIDVKNTVTDLMEALTEQPVSVAIQASRPSFQFYHSGIYADDECGDDLDHGVLAVGYGTEGGADYFLVRNSWGSTWGDQGYIKMARESKQVNGTCGILSMPSRPILSDD